MSRHRNLVLTRSAYLRNNDIIRYNTINLARRTGMLEKVFAAEAPALNINRPSDVIKITDFGQLISALVGVMLIISALLAFFFLILGGIQWITSGGDKAGMETARNKITHAIVGLIIVGASWAIMVLVQNFLGVSIIGGNLSFPTPYN